MRLKVSSYDHSMLLCNRANETSKPLRTLADSNQNTYDLINSFMFLKNPSGSSLMSLKCKYLQFKGMVFILEVASFCMIYNNDLIICTTKMNRITQADNTSKNYQLKNVCFYFEDGYCSGCMSMPLTNNSRS